MDPYPESMSRNRRVDLIGLMMNWHQGASEVSARANPNAAPLVPYPPCGHMTTT